MSVSVSPEQLEFCQRAWGLKPYLVFVRYVANHVYRGWRGDQEVYLRLTPVSRRAKGELEAELHWMMHLIDGGMRVAIPVRAGGGETVLQVEGATSFHAVVFERVEGRSLRDTGNISEFLVREWGRNVGLMHRLTQRYRDPFGDKGRPLWDVDDTIRAAERSLDVGDWEAYRLFHRCRDWMLGLDRTPGAFGLAHCDFHPGNFMVKDGVIGLFDFDDSAYHWFAYDLATAYQSVLSMLDETGQSSEAPWFRDRLLEGYLSEHSLSRVWLERVEAFLAYRSVLMYHWIKTGIQENVFSRMMESERRDLLLDYRNNMLQRSDGILFE